MAENATLFVVYNQSQSLLRQYFPSPVHDDPTRAAPLSIPQIATAAAIAGSAASFVLTPVELVKCKMQVQNIVAADALLAANTAALASGSPAVVSLPGSNQKPPGPVAITRSILQESGIKGLWLGQTGTFLRETGGSAAWFTTFEVLSTFFAQRRTNRGETSAGGGPVTKGDLAAWELMLSGASAGVIYNCVLFPADCIKSTIQTEDELRGSALKAGEQRRGFLQVGKDIYKARGIKGLYSGCGLTALRAAPSSALIFYMYVSFPSFP
jgi:ornithine carrier protein